MSLAEIVKPRRQRPKPAKRARAVIERPPPMQGWLSTDAEEVERRRWRGRTEIATVEALEPQQAHFGRFRVPSASGGAYEVEIRALDRPENSCACADHRVNGLGTCKHVEGVLAALQRRGARAFAAAAREGSARVELFLDRAGDSQPAIRWPRHAAEPVRRALAPFLTPAGGLARKEAEATESLLQAIDRLPAALRAQVRVSQHLEPWLEDHRRRAARVEARARFLAEVEAGRASLDVLKLPLLPYQREGMLHLAFAERALLADEMGLGKTIQAIAACELLRRLRGIGRVLVVCPASLKGEWEEQIARFSGLPVRIVSAGRAARLAAYAEPAFFNLVNYEQVMVDAADLQRLVRPDIVILDEAQRIKNWPTKTARIIKSLASPYAFVLTGTPLENRIDELYSIMQFIDPGLLGPLFRFNRDFYQLDERGRPVDYRNLDELTRRVKPVLLRRRKQDVEGELPGRTVTNYMVGMTPEQGARYDEVKVQAARLIHLAQRRPLTPQEFERLQRLLACMRMLCDTPYILDNDCRDSPKLEELERLLGDLLTDPDRKVIVFSEWERMLSLARELAAEMGIECAWHTGSVPQDRRRAEIARFKQDPGCRLFLSTDSGSVGLNLQAASAVINLDLPWNPAKLEQRIARAWRKHQQRAVDVINLVTENSIEHNILHLLGQKQALADGVLDGGPAPRMPSGRKAFMDRMAAAMAPPAASVPANVPTTHPLVEVLTRRHGEALLLLESHGPAGNAERFVAVIDGDADAARREHERLAGEGREVEVIDRASYETIARLAANGLLRPADADRRELHRSARLAAPADNLAARRVARSVELLGGAERKLRMAMLLAQGGFAQEAAPVLAECLELAAGARGVLSGEAPVEAETSATAEPPAGPAMVAELAGSVEQMLAQLRDSLRSLPAAA